MLGDLTDEIKGVYKGWLANTEHRDVEVMVVLARDQLAARRRAEFLIEHRAVWFSTDYSCGFCQSEHLDPRHNFTEENWKAAADEELTKQGQ